MKNVAASLMLILLWSAGEGLTVSFENTSEEAEPLIVSGEGVSVPPQIMVSRNPTRSSRAALMGARAPEVQAVETV